MFLFLKISPLPKQFRIKSLSCSSTRKAIDLHKFRRSPCRTNKTNEALKHKVAVNKDACLAFPPLGINLEVLSRTFYEELYFSCFVLFKCVGVGMSYACEPVSSWLLRAVGSNNLSTTVVCSVMFEKQIKTSHQPRKSAISISRFSAF